MILNEVPAVIDVHPPHEPVHGWRDFFLHLVTITIGLLIALSLEGLVEWQHHRHLVHEAEAGLRTEISGNASAMKDALNDLHKQQAALKQDVVVLRYIVKNHKTPEHSSMDITFHIHDFNDLSWKTAQTTTAVSYMSYEDAKQYSDIYAIQAALDLAERQAARDAIVSLGPFMNGSDTDADPTGGEAGVIEEKIEVLQGQLLLVDSYLRGLDTAYTKFLNSHPEK